MNKLFICNQNQNRSTLATELFGGESRGLYRNEVKTEDLEKADIVYVFEDFQRKEIGKRFPREYLGLKIINLDIPDTYNIANERSRRELEKILGEKMRMKRKKYKNAIK